MLKLKLKKDCRTRSSVRTSIFSSPVSYTKHFVFSSSLTLLFISSGGSSPSESGRVRPDPSWIWRITWSCSWRRHRFTIDWYWVHSCRNHGGLHFLICFKDGSVTTLAAFFFISSPVSSGASISITWSAMSIFLKVSFLKIFVFEFGAHSERFIPPNCLFFFL